MQKIFIKKVLKNVAIYFFMMYILDVR